MEITPFTTDPTPHRELAVGDRVVIAHRRHEFAATVELVGKVGCIVRVDDPDATGIEKWYHNEKGRTWRSKNEVYDAFSEDVTDDGATL